MIADLTALPLANASLLDEGTAAAEAMHMAQATAQGDRKVFIVADDVHPQTIAVVKTRALPLGIDVQVVETRKMKIKPDVFGVLLQYPATTGKVEDLSAIAAKAKAAGAVTTFAADLLALTLYKAPGEMGADICIGSAQRFGVPMGFGGPHAAFMSAREEMRRVIPGRIIGVSKDAQGKRGYRLALQTREQHIRRDKATSNICTAQVLLAVMASMYAAYHGPKGLQQIATRVHNLTQLLAAGLRKAGFTLLHENFFDTLSVKTTAGKAKGIEKRAAKRKINLRRVKTGLGVTLDESTASPTSRISSRCSRAFRSTTTSATLANDCSRRCSRSAAAHLGSSSPIPCSTGITPSTRCCATSRPSRAATSRSPTR
jgi:glycine dehydrogenase